MGIRHYGRIAGGVQQTCHIMSKRRAAAISQENCAVTDAPETGKTTLEAMLRQRHSIEAG